MLNCTGFSVVEQVKLKDLLAGFTFSCSSFDSFPVYWWFSSCASVTDVVEQP